MAPTNFACRIIELIGCEPVLAEKQPKGSNSILEVVKKNLDSCDAIVVIATADQQNEDTFSPSSGVSEELGILKDSEKFNGKFFVLVENGVTLSAMNSIARYSFDKNNFGKIAEAILIELGSMRLFKNYYEMPGSELDIHKLMETLSSLKDHLKNGHIDRNTYNNAVQHGIKNLLIRDLDEL